MRRAAHLAVALLLPALVAGCAPDSDPAADSLGRALAKQPTHEADAITLEQAVDGAPTVEFFAPVETEFEVTGPTTLPAGDVNISFTTEGNHNLSLAGPGVPVALIWATPRVSRRRTSCTRCGSWPGPTRTTAASRATGPPAWSGP